LIEGIKHLDDITVTAEFTERSISGSSGCNTYRVQYEVEGKRLLLLGAVAVTLMMCPDPQMVVETKFLERLARVTAFHINYQRLKLISDNGKPLLTLRRISVEDLLGPWRVLSIHIPERKAIVSVSDNLQLTFEKGLVHGDAGCNAFRGPWSLEGSALRLGPLVTTRKQCAETVMVQEQALLHALGSVTGWRVVGEHLSLLRVDGGIAVSLGRSGVDKPAVKPGVKPRHRSC
jgi:heat shock protein HslJ